MLLKSTNSKIEEDFSTNFVPCLIKKQQIHNEILTHNKTFYWSNTSWSSNSLLFSGRSGFSFDPFLMKIHGALSLLRLLFVLCVEMLSLGLCILSGVLGVLFPDRDLGVSDPIGVSGVTSFNSRWLPHCLTRDTTSSCFAHFVSVFPTATTKSPTFNLLVCKYMT